MDGFKFMMFNPIFNNISRFVILTENKLWRSVLLEDEAGESGGNYRPVASH